MPFLIRRGDYGNVNEAVFYEFEILANLSGNPRVSFYSPLESTYIFGCKQFRCGQSRSRSHVVAPRGTSIVDSSEEVLFLTSFGHRDAFASVSFLRSMATAMTATVNRDLRFMVSFVGGYEKPTNVEAIMQ